MSTSKRVVQVGDVWQFHGGTGRVFDSEVLAVNSADQVASMTVCGPMTLQDGMPLYPECWRFVREHLLVKVELGDVWIYQDPVDPVEVTVLRFAPNNDVALCTNGRRIPLRLDGTPAAPTDWTFVRRGRRPVQVGDIYRQHGSPTPREVMGIAGGVAVFKDGGRWALRSDGSPPEGWTLVRPVGELSRRARGLSWYPRIGDHWLYDGGRVWVVDSVVVARRIANLRELESGVTGLMLLSAQGEVSDKAGWKLLRREGQDVQEADWRAFVGGARCAAGHPCEWGKQCEVCLKLKLQTQASFMARLKERTDELADAVGLKGFVKTELIAKHAPDTTGSVLTSRGPRWSRDGFNRCRGPGYEKWCRFLAASYEQSKVQGRPLAFSPAMVASIAEEKVDECLQKLSSLEPRPRK